jgi:phosphoglucosamine mutase
VLQFGTDGVRGDAESQLTPDFVAALARAFVKVTGARRVLVARDPRESGPRIEADLAAGFAAEGAACESAGVLPTPGLAVLSRERNEWAAMISASHNRWSDNGIKFFAPGGTKLSDEHQTAIETLFPTIERGVEVRGVSGSVDASPVYEAWLCEQVGESSLVGLRVVLDCANGAASSIAPAVFERLGAVVNTIHAAPDGRNINDGCGSTHLDSLRAAVIEHQADLGLAFDGDADRVLAVDESGEVVDGDQILAIMAIALRERAALTSDTIAVTVMSNLGLRRALSAHGIGLVETAVGDRHVVAAMERDDLALGGEQSGHIIFGHRARTGDGTLTGLLLAARVVETSRPLSELAAVMTRLPQVLVNVRVAGRIDLTTGPVAATIAEVERELGDDGRVLVRPSGTEPLVRVMVEAPTTERAESAAQRVVVALESTP